MGTPPKLTVVVPVFNERENVAELVTRLAEVLRPVSWEVIFVDDDSADGTADHVRQMARQDTRVRCIQRIGRRGLSSAVIEGMLASSSPFIAVMDGDLQHDESLLPKMLDVLSEPGTDLVIGSRLVEGGGNEGLTGIRLWGSQFSSKFTRRLFNLNASDLMSGYFMLHRNVLEESVRDLSGTGFKILLDILLSSPRELKTVELPYTFRTRQSGSSKLDINVVVSLAMTIIDKKLGWLLPYRMVGFLMVGGTGVVVHFIVLSILLKLLGVSFVVSQTAATLVAMTSNFALNNLFTYRDVRLSGWAWVKGWLSYVAVCSLGAAANVGVANAMYQDEFSWQIAALAGILIGTVWNYAATKLYTWRQ